MFWEHAKAAYELWHVLGKSLDVNSNSGTRRRHAVPGFAFQLPSPKGVRQRANFLQREVFTLKLSYDDVKLEDR